MSISNSLPLQILSNAVSIASSQNSVAGNITEALGYSIQAVWSAGSGTPGGTFKLQACNDGVNWSDLPNSGATANITLSGNSGVALWNVADVYYGYVRLVYTQSAGSATLNASLSTKA